MASEPGGIENGPNNRPISAGSFPLFTSGPLFFSAPPVAHVGIRLVDDTCDVFLFFPVMAVVAVVAPRLLIKIHYFVLIVMFD